MLYIPYLIIQSFYFLYFFLNEINLLFFYYCLGLFFNMSIALIPKCLIFVLPSIIIFNEVNIIKVALCYWNELHSISGIQVCHINMFVTISLKNKIRILFKFFSINQTTNIVATCDKFLNS